MEKFIKAASSDLLADAVPESLKNMLLVMDTAGIFVENNVTTPIWDLTWEKLDSFLPNLMTDLFGDRYRGLKDQQQQDLPHQNLRPENQDLPPQELRPENQDLPPQEVKPGNQDLPQNAKAVEDLPPIESTATEEPKVEEDMPKENVEVERPKEELPPHSPLDPPIKAPTFFYKDGGPHLVSTVVPPPPKFDPLPPPPIKMGLNFQPIQVAPVSNPSVVRLVNPKPVMPPNIGAPTGSTPLSNYFPMAPMGSGSLISAAFTPTIGSGASTVFLGGGSDPLHPTSKEAK